MRRLAALAATTAQQRPEQAFAAALQRLDTLLDTHDRGAMALTRELVGNEQGEALYSDSRQLVSREILGAVQGHRLPRLLLLFLQHIWSKYLYVTYLRKGMDSPDWQRGLQDIQVLVKSFSITDPDDLLDFYAQELARTLARVRVQTSSIHGDRELAARFFELMDAVPIRIMGGDPPAPQEAMVTAVPESVSGEGPEDIDPTLTDDLRVGQWYLLRERELEQRCRLVERNAQFHYCLFTNLSGIKTARLDLLEVAERRRAKQLRPISTEESIPQGLAFACRELARQLPRLEQEADKAERERAAQAEHRRARETAERLRRRHQQQVQEQARLLEEQRRQEQERLRLQAEAREATERQTRERALQKALTDVARIQSGGMLDTVDADGGRRRLRLGLKLKSNGKLIFVDRLGRKELELFPNELAQRLVAGSAAIADFGVAFDDTLGRLINDRSERIHADEER
jgi:hypothetical protein